MCQEENQQTRLYFSKTDQKTRGCRNNTVDAVNVVQKGVGVEVVVRETGNKIGVGQEGKSQPLIKIKQAGRGLN